MLSLLSFKSLTVQSNLVQIKNVYLIPQIKEIGLIHKIILSPNTKSLVLK